MGKLFDQIRKAVREERFMVGWHADERYEEREVTDWQIVSGLEPRNGFEKGRAANPSQRWL